MSLLCAYVINGSPVNEINQYEVHQLNGNEPFVAADTVPAGYQDISSIDNWSKYGNNTGKDYKYIRVQIYTLVVTLGWANLSIAEKTIASIYFVVDTLQRLEVHTIPEQIINGKTHHQNSKASRWLRHDAALMQVFNTLSKADAQAVLKKLEAAESKPG